MVTIRSMVPFEDRTGSKELTRLAALPANDLTTGTEIIHLRVRSHAPRSPPCLRATPVQSERRHHFRSTSAYVASLYPFGRTDRYLSVELVGWRNRLIGVSVSRGVLHRAACRSG